MSTDAQPILDIDELEFGYDSPLLNIKQFKVAASEHVAVLGPSGCGKTTFMHLVAGLLKPKLGSIKLNGTEITTLTEPNMDRIRGREIGIVFQRLHLVPSISVLENLLLAQRLSRTEIDKPYAMQLLEQLNVQELFDKKPSQLSQGQAQRVAIARSLVHKPRLLMADEPTSALDDDSALDAINLLLELTTSSNAALLVVTHDERVRSRMNRVYELDTST